MQERNSHYTLSVVFHAIFLFLLHSGQGSIIIQSPTGSASCAMHLSPSSTTYTSFTSCVAHLQMGKRQHNATSSGGCAAITEACFCGLSCSLPTLPAISINNFSSRP